MALIVANGIEHSYELTGDGPLLVLVSGMIGTAAFWAPQIAAFSADYRVLTYDQRGAGHSGAEPVTSVEQLADDLAALLDALALERVHLVGHSTGGAIGQVMAIEHGPRLESLAICSSLGRSDAYRARIWDLRTAMLDAYGPLGYAQLTSLTLYPPIWIRDNAAALAEREAATTARAAPPEVMKSRIAAIRAFDRTGDLGRIATPTLVTCARDDIQTPLYLSEEIASLVPGAEFEVMDWGGHANTIARPDAYNALIAAWLARHR